MKPQRPVAPPNVRETLPTIGWKSRALFLAFVLVFELGVLVGARI
jgi:hypothetical protein